jgi:hypothetical protein
MSEQRTSAIASWEAGRLDVFRRGIDGKLYHKYFQNGWGADRKLKGLFAPPRRLRPPPPPPLPRRRGLQPGDTRGRTGWTGPATAGQHSFKLADQVIE